MWIDREISQQLQHTFNTFPATVLIGPRQVGKTALLEHVFPQLPYISFDIGANAEFAESRPNDFLRQHPPPILIDEVQYAPAFFRHIKTRIDQRRGEKGLFALTGSQNFALMENVSDSLAGRAAVIPFLGLSGKEWRAGHARKDWADLLWRGGFPALWNSPDNPVDRDRWYQGYLATYLERDVRNLLNVGSLREFERFIRACAARCAQTLNMSELGRDIGVSATTARTWISLLQASNQIVLLEPYFRSLGKRLSKSPKLYFTDTGLAAFLMGFQSKDAMWSSPYAGALWETYVVGQWLRWKEWHHPAATLWYWRDQANNEVDLVVELNQQLVAIECKLTNKPHRHHLQGLRKLRYFYGEDFVHKAFLACTTDAPFEIDEGVVAQPGWTTWDLF